MHPTSDDSIATFAGELRRLRRDRGNPTLVALVSETGISRSVVSDAFGGRKLPSENTTALLVETLGGDRAEWLARREALSAQLRPRSTDRARRAARLPVWALVLTTASASAIIAAVATSAAWALLILPRMSVAATPSASSTGEYIPYADGVDPMQTICRDDAVIAASEERLGGQFQVQMMYSKQCMAVWGRVTRYDGEAGGDSLRMLIYPAIDMNSSRNQERSAFDVQSIYTTLMIEPDVEARVCGIATVTQNGQKIELGPPLCV